MKLGLSLTTIGLVILSASTGIALDEVTHEVVNEQAARQSQFDNVLREVLGLREGINEQFRGLRAFQWLRVGGTQEDKPLCRSTRHFHDPLKSWDQAGLSVPPELFLIVSVSCGASQFPSSLVWSQTDPQVPGDTLGGNWSWQQARRHYAKALTATSPADREQGWADALRGVGQAMHLVVDASVPEHVRNDVHIMEAILRKIGLRGYGNYEYWVSDQHADAEEEAGFVTRYLSTPVLPDPLVLGQGTGDQSLRIPIARLIDTDRYTGADPNVTIGGPVGVAEFANANFFSEDTANRQYPFPNIDGLVASQNVVPSGSHVRRYYDKAAGDGVPVSPALAECVFDEAAFDAGLPRSGTCTDANVWARVAENMLPRAVGYSAALLDYFFRGRVTAEVAVFRGDSGPAARVSFGNLTPDETMDGSFEIYYDASDGTRRQLGSWPLLLNPNEFREAATISPLPADTPLSPWIIVFRGQLGSEPDAVAAREVRLGYTGQLHRGYREFVEAGVVFDPALPLFLFSIDQSNASAFFQLVDLTGINRIRSWSTFGATGVSTVFSVGRISDVIYRDADASAGNLVEITFVPGFMVCEGHGSSTINNHVFDQVSEGPSTSVAELVEFDPPADFATLLTYTGLNPPTIRRVLLQVSNAMSGTAVVDLGDARFFGLRLTTVPDDPGLPPLLNPLPNESTGSDERHRSCRALVFVRFP